MQRENQSFRLLRVKLGSMGHKQFVNRYLIHDYGLLLGILVTLRHGKIAFVGAVQPNPAISHTLRDANKFIVR